LYVEGGEEPLQVVGIEGDVANKGVVDDEGAVCEGDKGVLGDVGGELNELMCYDWMNNGLEGVDFIDDIFGGNKDDEDHNASHGEHAETSRQHEVGGNEGNNSTHAETSWQHDVGGNRGNNVSNAQPLMQLEVGSNERNNAQPSVGIDRSKIR
jgi:hypothetical protein